MSENDMIVFRITETEKKIATLDEQLGKTNEQINDMQVKIAQTNAYVKQIYDDLHDGMRRPMGEVGNGGKLWAKVMLEMIRALITISGIIAGIKLLT